MKYSFAVKLPVAGNITTRNEVVRFSNPDKFIFLSDKDYFNIIESKTDHLYRTVKLFICGFNLRGCTSGVGSLIYNKKLCGEEYVKDVNHIALMEARNRIHMTYYRILGEACSFLDIKVGDVFDEFGRTIIRGNDIKMEFDEEMLKI